MTWPLRCKLWWIIKFSCMVLSIQLKIGQWEEQRAKHCHAWTQVHEHTETAACLHPASVVPPALFWGSSEPEKQKPHPVNRKYFSKVVFRSCHPSQRDGNRVGLITAVAYPEIQVKPWSTPGPSWIPVPGAEGCVEWSTASVSRMSPVSVL